MAKILEQNSIENTNMDGAFHNYCNVSYQSGILKNRYNDCNITSSSNQIIIDTGELIISGFRIVIDTPITLSITGTPSTKQNYSLIATLNVNDANNISFETNYQLTTTTLTQNEIFKSNSGIYQIRLATFDYDGTISNLVKVALKIQIATREYVNVIINDIVGGLNDSLENTLDGD